MRMVTIVDIDLLYLSSLNEYWIPIYAVKIPDKMPRSKPFWAFMPFRAIQKLVKTDKNRIKSILKNEHINKDRTPQMIPRMLVKYEN